ncbi:hypothetical protein F5X68DRAFT_204578 [Plectosphaerella plurivora]|uniref:Secreted protein n=1 Tax=Plectosphaerella plurivora TaxID=936078 RepID=A0A9P8VE11_9PEZI|nr:hypothetical protein F5X68DRAFT_204578 [Plectosphaerella plurivora]
MTVALMLCLSVCSEAGRQSTSYTEKIARLQVKTWSLPESLRCAFPFPSQPKHVLGPVMDTGMPCHCAHEAPAMSPPRWQMPMVISLGEDLVS